MPTSATGLSNSRPPHASSRGFSLLEVLVVVTIIGIFAGSAVLYIGVTGRDRVVEREVLRLSSLLELLREEALMQSRDFGVLFSESGYRFYIYDHVQGSWVEPPGDRLLRQHALPERLRLSLVLEDRDVRLAALLDDDALEMPEPQIFVLSSGELTPFTAGIGRDLGTSQFTLSAELDGKLRISAPGLDAL